VRVHLCKRLDLTQNSVFSHKAMGGSLFAHGNAFPVITECLRVGRDDRFGPKADSPSLQVSVQETMDQRLHQVEVIFQGEMP
jgi:hypothetical protein